MRAAAALGALAVAFLVLGPVHPSGAPSLDARSADRDAIRGEIDRIFKAFIGRDRHAIRSLHSKDFRGFPDSSTRTIIRGVDEYMHEATSDLDDPVGLTRYQFVDFDVKFYGNVAVVPYIADIELDGEGRHISTTLRVLDVYAKQEGRWVQVASDTGLTPEAQLERQTAAVPAAGDRLQEVLKAREAVWRACFRNDRPQLAELVPDDLITIEPGQTTAGSKGSLLADVQAMADAGVRLTRLEFPETKIQMFGGVAILYSSYVYATEAAGATRTVSGRATEVFVRRRGKWANVGWHLDAVAADTR